MILQKSKVLSVAVFALLLGAIIASPCLASLSNTLEGPLFLLTSTGHSASDFVGTWQGPAYLVVPDGSEPSLHSYTLMVWQTGENTVTGFFNCSTFVGLLPFSGTTTNEFLYFPTPNPWGCTPWDVPAIATLSNTTNLNIHGAGSFCGRPGHYDAYLHITTNYAALHGNPDPCPPYLVDCPECCRAGGH